MLDSPKLPQRFWDKVSPEPNSGCWLRTACVNRQGYGFFRLEGKNVYAHRLAYDALVGGAPARASGLVLDHLCRTRCCVNPGHLEPVSNAENVRRGHGPGSLALEQRMASRAACANGHAWPGAMRLNCNGHRICIECNRECVRRYAAKRRAA